MQLAPLSGSRSKSSGGRAARSAWRPKLLALLTGSLLAGALVGCSSGASASDCDALREKLVELEFAAMGAKATAELRDQLAKQKKDTNTGVAERFAAACTKKTPKPLIECALGATSLEAVKLCDQQQ